MVDAEKEIMFTALYNIACGETIVTRKDMVKLAAKALEQINKIKGQKINSLAEKKINDDIEVDIDEILNKR